MKLAIALALMATTATADMMPDSVSIPLYVNHGNYIYDDWNQGVGNNLGVLLSWDVTDAVQFTAGVYNNSFSELSATASFEYASLRGDNWSLGAFAGIATYPIETTPLYMPSRLGDSDVVVIGGLRAEAFGVWATYTPSGAEGRNIITSGITFDF